MAATTKSTSRARTLRVGLKSGFVAGLLALTACQGSVDDPSAGAPGAPGAPGTAGSGGPQAGGSSSSTGGSSSVGGSGTAGGTTQPPVDVGSVIDVDPNTLPDGIAANSRVLRLSYAEYDRVLSDLLGIAVDEARNFPAEQPNLGPYVGYAGLVVNERLITELERSATSLAEKVVGTPAAYAAVVGCDPAAATCRDTFINGFGLKALRRPLTDAEKTRYRGIFDKGAALVASGNAFRDGVRVTLQAMLQSPKFLYRLEAGDGKSDAGGALLSSYEVAARLSFMLAGTTPDAALLAAAADGSLSTAAGIAAQARRLADSAAFESRSLGFHERWMQLDELRSLAKDTQTFPTFSPELVDSMRGETERFIRAVTLEGTGAVSELLSSRFGFVDQRLAALYGIQGNFGADLVRVDHAPESKRLGLFTQASFLAGHSSSSSGTSPILRGVFLLRRVACANIPDPPAGAAMQEPPTKPATEIQTTREYVTWKTSMAACAGCHTLINPTGFAFEHFDGLGQWRDQERGANIDATGTLRLGSKELPFMEASELLAQLAQEPQVQACYAKNWLQFAYGRQDVESDSRTLGLAAQKLKAGGFSIRDLAVSLTERPAFNHLSPKAE